jgi:uncharacterized protein (DUF2235 family)
MKGSKSKKLVVFFDGTWNRADQTNDDGKPCPTNVAKLFQATLPGQAGDRLQIIHYVQGVGTRRLERITGGGFGFGISDNIKDGYRFLVSNYKSGDDIYIFGFSRGAFSARSLAGMIRNVGILRREKFFLVNKAYDKYRNRSKGWQPDGADAVRFKRENTCGNETIRFLGVFDTVGALGAPFGIVLTWIIDKLFRSTFHDTQLSSIVKSAYHALAIDEHRLPFRPTQMKPNKNHNPSNFEEKWFPGVHSNVGGGYATTGLSDVSLEWMAAKAMEHGLELDLQRIADPPFCPDPGQAAQYSQKWLYRLGAVLCVKLPGCIGLVPKSYADVFPNLRWTGDYIRPVPRPKKAD